MASASVDIRFLQNLTSLKGSSLFFDVPTFIKRQDEFLKTMEPFVTLMLQGLNLGEKQTNEIPKAVLLISMPLSNSKLDSIELERQLRKVEYGNVKALFTKAGDTDLSHMFEFTEVKDVYTPDAMKNAITQFLQKVSLERYLHATIILNGHGGKGGICLEGGAMSYESLYGHIQQCYLNVETTGTNLKGLMVLNGTCLSFTGEKDHPADPRIVVNYLTNPKKPNTTSKIYSEKDEQGNVMRIVKAHHMELEKEAREQYRETLKQLEESGHVIKSYAVTNEGKICLI